MDRAALINQIKTTIRDLPDNPDIKRLGHGCFVLSWGKLRDNWSPEFHDFKKQYELVINYLNSVKDNNFIAAYVRVLNERRVPVPTTKQYHTIHPGVADHLTKLLTGSNTCTDSDVSAAPSQSPSGASTTPCLVPTS